MPGNSTVTWPFIDNVTAVTVTKPLIDDQSLSAMGCQIIFNDAEKEQRFSGCPDSGVDLSLYVVKELCVPIKYSDRISMLIKRSNKPSQNQNS